MRIAIVVGARPQLIKASPLVTAAERAGHDVEVLHAGQHVDPLMSGRFFAELGLNTPVVTLSIDDPPGAARTDAMQGGLRRELERRGFDHVVVIGDTDATLAGARAAHEATLPLAHVEAGVRSSESDLPEERNRIEVDRIADLLLAPNERAVEQLREESVPGATVVTGDVLRDALDLVPEDLGSEDTATGGSVLLTVHRAANTDDRSRLADIIAAMGTVQGPVFFPVHPRTAGAISAAGISMPDAIERVDPLGYADLVGLERRARVIVTDSGGIQKEAYWLGVPCVTLRERTEWMETVELGWNRLVGADPGAIVDAVRTAVRPSEHPDLYGDGHAATRCIEALERSS